jgi:aminoglycoside phosphotransferase
MAPVPTPEVLWRKPPVLALAALPGTALGRLGEPSTASPEAWAAAGAAARMLHDAPLPPWPGGSLDEIASHLDGECEWLLTNGVLPADLVTRNRRVAEAALRPWTPVFTHGDLQVAHVFVDVDEITGVVDWSEAGCARACAHTWLACGGTSPRQAGAGGAGTRGDRLPGGDRHLCLRGDR